VERDQTGDVLAEALGEPVQVLAALGEEDRRATLSSSARVSLVINSIRRSSTASAE
jgi:hypothetical protein